MSNKQELLLTPEERARIINKAAKDNVGIIEAEERLLKAQLSKAKPIIEKQLLSQEGVKASIDSIIKKEREEAKREEGDKKLSELKRFWQKVQIADNGCWLWTGCLYPTGYACFELNGKTTRAHRFIYEIMKGEIPPELQLDHTCFNKACVNPNHLEIVTNQENTRRYYKKHVTHCPQGHPYDEENTLINSKGHRECKICYANTRKRYIERRRVKSQALKGEK